MIIVKSKKEIGIMSEAGKILASIMKELKERVEPGITTMDLERLAESLIFKYKAKPSFKGYDGYPYALCASTNEEIVHALPSGRVLKEGDIISLDLGVLYQGFHSDMAITLAVGEIEPETARLVKAARKALKRGVKKVRPGNTFGDVSNTIQRYIEDEGFGIVKDLCGHGIGRDLHEDPKILNYGKRKTGSAIKEGMCFCLEPMLAMASGEIVKSFDGFGYKTKDNSLSAHFEQTMAVVNGQAQILTPFL